MIDPILEQHFPVMVFVLRNSNKKSFLPKVKILLPTKECDTDGICYTESATLLQNSDGNWTKNAYMEFDREAREILGAKNVTETEELTSLDIVVIAQTQEMLEATRRTIRRVPA